MPYRSPTSPTRVSYHSIGRRCNLVEQRLLCALRRVGDPATRVEAVALLDGLGLDADGIRAFTELVPLLPTGQAPIDLLQPGSPFIGATELDLLACVHRLSQWRRPQPRVDRDTAELTALRSQLARCARSARDARLGLRLTALSPVGLRLLDPSAWVRT
jgi:hypothetical protein